MTVTYKKFVPEEHRYGGQIFTIKRRLTKVGKGAFGMSVDDEVAYENAVREAKREGRDLPTPKQIAQVRKKLGLSQRRLAVIVGGGVRSIQKYESGYQLPGMAVSNLLKVLAHHPELIELLKTRAW